MIARLLEIRPLRPEDAPELARMFKALVEAGDERWFHPHPLDDAAAQAVCAPRQDLYAGAFVNGDVVAYGMLPRMRRLGLGMAMLAYLNSSAALRGAKRVRGRVYPANVGALRMDARMGYVFSRTPDASGQLVGYVRLQGEDA